MQIWTIEQGRKKREISSTVCGNVNYQSQVCLCLLCVLDSRLCNQKRVR